MKLNERYIRNVIKRVINEMGQNNEFITAYNEFLSEKGYWEYDGNQFVYEDGNFTMEIPCPIDEAQNGSDESLDNFDLDTFVAKSWIEGNLPKEIARFGGDICTFYNYASKLLSDLINYSSPSAYFNSIGTEEEEY